MHGAMVLCNSSVLLIISLGNQIPSITVSGNNVTKKNDRYFLQVNKDEEVTFTVNGTDDGEFTYRLTRNSVNATLGDKAVDDTADVKINISKSQPVNIRFSIHFNIQLI